MPDKPPARTSVPSAGPSTRPTEAQMMRDIKAFEKASKLTLCLKVFQPQAVQGTLLERLGERRGLHTSRFCMATKRTQNRACIECDLQRIPQLCTQKHRRFTHTCHAGADEIIIPLFSAGQLVAIAYLGQFRRSADQPGTLPLAGPALRRHLDGLAGLMEGYLNQARIPRFPKETSHGYRGERIHRFLEANLNCDLQALAQHLALSPSRATHVVREATGLSFAKLRDQLRLQRAQNLLQTTYYKIAVITHECGFSSPRYFHRFFRQHTGLTPLTFRRQNQHQA